MHQRPPEGRYDSISIWSHHGRGHSVSSHGGKMTVYASWNGATGVAAWRVFAGSRPSKMPAVATASKRGFETAINARARPYVTVEALDAEGLPLARSPIQHGKQCGTCRADFAIIAATTSRTQSTIAPITARSTIRSIIAPGSLSAAATSDTAIAIGMGFYAAGRDTARLLRTKI